MGRSTRIKQQQQSAPESRRAARPTRIIYIILCFALVLCVCVLRRFFWSTGPHVVVAHNTEWQDADVESVAQNTEWQDADVDVEFPCTVDVVDVAYFSMSVFRAKYAFKKPLIVRGGAKNWPAQKLWTKSFMKEQYGSGKVTPFTSKEQFTKSGE